MLPHNYPVLFILFLYFFLAAAAWGETTKPIGDTHQPTEKEQIRTTLQQYAMFLDDGRIDDCHDLFTTDAHFTAAGFDYKGKEVIRRELADKKRRPGKHLPFPAIIEFETGSKARAWSDFLRVKITREGDPSARHGKS